MNQCNDMIRALFGRWFTVVIVETHLAIRNVHERLRRLRLRGYHIDSALHPDGKRKIYRIRLGKTLGSVQSKPKGATCTDSVSANIGNNEVVPFGFCQETKQ